MNETALAKKNNISAYLFLATAILTLLGSVLIILFLLAMSNPFLTGPKDSSIMNGTIIVLALFCVITVASQIAGFILMKKRARNARIAAFVAVILTVVTFAPFVVLLIYPLVFLLGDEGKNFYKIS
jgi:uncharacterized membrane protein